MLDPCNITLDLDTVNNSLATSNSSISVNIEPMNIRIGFKHIDFANVVMAHITGTLEYV